MIAGVDLDGTLTKETDGWDYASRTPRKEIIKKVNFLHKRGFVIIIYTARKECDRSTTIAWLKKHKVKYDDIILDKPKFDVYIGDETMKPEDL